MITLLTLLIVSPLSDGKAPLRVTTHPAGVIYAQVKKNAPRLDKAFAHNLAITIEAASKKYDVNARQMAAIAFQESSYRLAAKRCYSLPSGAQTCDRCLMQINDRTSDAFGFDKDRLLTDVNYCVEAGAKVLKDFKMRHGAKEKDYWSRFNTSNLGKRRLYYAAVSRYF